MFIKTATYVKNKKEMNKMGKWDEFKEYETSKKYMKKLAFKGGSKNTLKNALRSLGNYCFWRGKNPDELIAEAEAAVEAKKKDFADELLIDYFNFLVSIGLKRTSAKTAYAYVRSFYKKNGILLYEEGPDAVTETRINLPTRGELHKVWQAADLDEKIVLSILRSGMRPETLTELTYGEVKRDIEAGEERLYIKKIAGKRKLWFATFLTKEATEILRLNLEKRKAAGEEFTDSTPLVTRQREPGETITTDMVWRIVKGAGERIGVKLMPKIFRKWFRTYCSPEIGRDATMKMGAWKIPGVGESYFLPPREETLKNFLKIERLLLFEEPTPSVKEPSDEEILEAIRTASPEQRALLWTSIKTYLPVWRSKKLDPEVTKLVLEENKKTETNGGCADCQRIVSEEKLPNLLAQGWRVSAMLPSGKIVVENNGN